MGTCLLVAQIACGQADYLVQRGDNYRTGANLNEPTLTASTVNAATFGKMFTLRVDGYVYAQPLYKSNLAIPGLGTHNVVFVATEHDSVYAFDADTATPLWMRSFIDPAAGVTSQPATDPSVDDIMPEVGVTSTPVIDPASGILYVVAKTNENGAVVFRIHALDIATGADRIAPVMIHASVVEPAGGTLTLTPSRQQQRPGLVLVNGVVYVGFGSHGDGATWQGWLIGYDAATLAQVTVFCDEPDGSTGGGFWASGQAPPVDANGNLFMATGNGPFDGRLDYGDSFLRLTTSGGLAVADYFAPFNQAALNAADLDIATAGVTLLPDSAGTAAHPHLMVGSDKDGTIYVIDRDNMGHFNGSYTNPDSQIVQEIPNALGVISINTSSSSLPYVENTYTNAAYWNNHLYWCAINDHCKMFTFSNGLIVTPPVTSATSYPFGGGQPVISAASSTATSAIMWALQRDTTNNITTLRAYDATNPSNELYDTNQAAGGRDRGGPPVKFATPTVINGEVFVGAQSEVDVYGILANDPPQLPTPTFSPAPGAYSSAVSVTLGDANGSAQIYYTLDGSAPMASSTPYTGPITVSATTTISAIAVLSGYRVSPVASATYTIGVVPFAYVQGGSATPQSPQSSVTVPYAANQISGDMNLVVVGWNDSTHTVASVTDSSGNAYALAVGPTVQSGAASQSIYYAKNIVGAAAGANRVTVTFSGAATYPDIRIAEYSGLDTNSPLDVTAAAQGSSSLSASGPATTSAANELIVGANLVQTHTTAAGTGFTSRMITTPDGDILEDETVATAGTYSASAPIMSAKWIMQMAAFKQASMAQVVTPTAPSSLSASAASSTQIGLTWGAATESGGTISQYLIERCAGGGCTGFAQIGTSTSTTFSDSGLTASTSYSYRVRAQDASGNTGPYSNVATATTQAPIVPTAPSNLVAGATGTTQIGLSWGAASESGGAIGQYLIERCSGGGCANFAQIATSTTTTYTDSGLSGSTSYTYRVRAQDTTNNTGPYSNLASATTAAPTFTAPSGLTAGAMSGSQINLNWTAATETGGTISAYLVERCQGAGCSNFAQIGTTTGTSYNDVGLTAATSYSYRVRPTDAANDLGPYSNVATASTGAAAPPPITFVQGNYATPQSAQSLVSVPFTGPQAAGDLSVVVVGWNDSTTTVGAVTDSSGNVYRLAVGPTVQSGTATQAIYYAANIVGANANANAVTVSFNGSARYADVRILEYGGIDTTSPLDVAVGAIGSGSPSNSGAVTTTYANDLLIGANLVQQHTTSAGTGFTSRMITMPDGDIAEDEIVATTGSYSASAPVNSGKWIMQMAAFRRHP